VEWAEDNWFGILGILIGVLVAVGQVFWQRQPKTLDYEVRNKLPLLAPQTHEASRGLSAPLHLYYGDELVRNPYLLTEVFSTDWPFGGAQDKGCCDDGADSLRAQPDAVERLPAGLEQRYPAFALGA
jgi:hypothetical protein